MTFCIIDFCNPEKICVKHSQFMILPKYKVCILRVKITVANIEQNTLHWSKPNHKKTFLAYLPVCWRACWVVGSTGDCKWPDCQPNSLTVTHLTFNLFNSFVFHFIHLLLCLLIKYLYTEYVLPLFHCILQKFSQNCLNGHLPFLPWDQEVLGCHQYLAYQANPRGWKTWLRLCKGV